MGSIAQTGGDIHIRPINTRGLHADVKSANDIFLSSQTAGASKPAGAFVITVDDFVLTFFVEIQQSDVELEFGNIDAEIKRNI